MARLAPSTAGACGTLSYCPCPCVFVYKVRRIHYTHLPHSFRQRVSGCWHSSSMPDNPLELMALITGGLLRRGCGSRWPSLPQSRTHFYSQPPFARTSSSGQASHCRHCASTNTLCHFGCSKLNCRQLPGRAVVGWGCRSRSGSHWSRRRPGRRSCWRRSTACRTG